MQVIIIHCITINSKNLSEIILKLICPGLSKYSHYSLNKEEDNLQ